MKIVTYVTSVLLVATGASAQISNPINCAFVSSVPAVSTLTTSVFGAYGSSCLPTAANVTGDFIVVEISGAIASGAPTISSVTDTLGDTFSLAQSLSGTYDGLLGYIYYAQNIQGGTGDQVTVTWTGGTFSGHVYAKEYSGGALSGLLDTTAVNTGMFIPSPGPYTVQTSLTTALANELIDVLVSSNQALGTTIAGSGFQLDPVSNNNFQTEWQIVTAAQAYTALLTYGQPVHVVEVAAAFEPATIVPTAPTNVQVVGASNTQVEISYTAPSASACALAVSTSPTYSPIVNDLITDPGGSSDLARTTSTVSSGFNRTVVIGKRNAVLSGINGYATQRVSNALLANTAYYYSITCGGPPATGTFTTNNIPLGIGYGPPWPTDPTVPGAWAAPSSPGAIANEQWADPITGLPTQRTTYPGFGWSTGTQATNTAYNQGQLPCDTAGPWVTPCNAAGSSGYASVSNSTAPVIVRPNSITSNWGDGLSSCVTTTACGGYIQQLQVNITGYCTSTTSSKCQVGVALSENAGASNANAVKTVTLPFNSPATVTVGTNNPGATGIDPWVYDSSPKLTLYDSFQYIGTVTTSGSSVSWLSGNYFNSTWTNGGGGRIRFSNTSAADACTAPPATNHSVEQTIASGFGTSLTLTGTPGAYTYYCAQDFAVMINRVVADASTSIFIQNVTLSYVTDNPGEWYDSGQPTIVTHEAVNNGYLMEVNTGGAGAQLSWVYPPTGFVQVIGPMQVNAKTSGTNTWIAQACPAFSPEFFIAIDDTLTTPTFYCTVKDTAGNTILLQVQYTGACCTTSSLSNNYQNGAAIGTGTCTNTDNYTLTCANATIIDLTPSSLGLSLSSLLTTYLSGPVQVPAAQPLTTCSMGPVQQGNITYYCNLGQDTMAYLFSISPGNRIPADAGSTGAHVVASLNTWGYAASRFSGLHTIGDYGQNNPYLGYYPEPIGAGAESVAETTSIVTTNTTVPSAGVSCATWGNPLGITGNNCIDFTINSNSGSYAPYYWTSIMPNGVVGTAYSQPITASGGTGPYTYAVTSGSLPTSFTLSSGGTISGAPSVAATYTFGVTATDSLSNTGSQVFTINTGSTAGSGTYATDVVPSSTIHLTATNGLQGSAGGTLTTLQAGDFICISESIAACSWPSLAQEYLEVLQVGSPSASDVIARRGPYLGPLASITAGTYTSLASGSLAGTGTCTLTGWGAGARWTGQAAAVATVPITGGVITGGATLTFSNTGSGYSMGPTTTATLSPGSGTGVCSGSANVSLTLTPDSQPKFITIMPSNFSNQAGVPGWGGMYPSPNDNSIPSPIYGNNVFWNSSTDPTGQSTIMDPAGATGHSFYRPTQSVGASNLPYAPGTTSYDVRYSASSFAAMLATPLSIAIANPTFHSVLGSAISNVYQSHPGPSGENASVNTTAFDVRPLTGQAATNPGTGPYQQFVNVTGNIWSSTWTGGNYTNVDDFGAVNRKVYATAANSGPHPLVDVSGPSSNIATASQYTYCVTRAASECYTGSSVGQIYVNVPGVVYPWCYGNPTSGTSNPQVNDICISNASPVGQSGLQFTTTTSDLTAALQRVIVSNTMNGATHETAGFGNIHMLPDNSWAMFQGNFVDGISRNDYMAQVPPYPATDSFNREDFIPIAVVLTTPSGLSITNAVIQFGYIDYGGNCTTRNDPCLANTTTVPSGTAPFHYASESPAGLSCSSSCTITIPGIAGMMLYYTVQFRNSANSVVNTQATVVTPVATTPASVTLTVLPTTLPSGTTGVVYSQTVTATGGASPYTFTQTAGTMIPGCSLSSAGTISGTPSTAGTYGFTVTATDALGNTGSQAYSVQIVMVTVSPLSLPSGNVSTPYSQTVSASGGTAPYTFAVTTGSLPAGLSLASTTGIISGTPTTAATYPFTITATDAGSHTGSQAYSVVIAPAIMVTLSPTSLANGLVGTAYSQTVTASGGTSPYTYAVSVGVLPTGLSLNSSTGTITGTPSAAASYSFTLSATDSATPTPHIGTQAYTVIINQIVLSPTALPGGTVGTAYSQTITASGGTAPYSFTITAGSLPGGLSLSTAGIISGIPTGFGSFSFTITATDSLSNTGSQAYSLPVVSASVTSSLMQGGAVINGTVTTAAAQPLPFKTITLTTAKHLAPSLTNGTGNYFPGLPTATGGGPASGYQGANVINPNMVILNPYLNGGVGRNPVVMAYVGGPTGTFGCNGTGVGACAANFSWFNLTQLDATYGVAECQSVTDNNGIVYFSPGTPLVQDFFAVNINGAAAMTTGGGGATTAITNSANYAWFTAPTSFATSGNGYGWCTDVFDSVHGKIYYIPTGAGPSVCPAQLLQYNQSGGSFPAQFTSSNFQNFNLKSIDTNACGYLGGSYDGQRYLRIWPLKGAPMIQYDTTLPFNNSGGVSYKELVMSNLCTSGHPACIGTGNVNAVQTASGYGGGIEIWDAAGANQYLYMAPFAVLPPGATSFSQQVLQSQVLRVKTATCSSPVAGSQSCASGFTAIDITSSGSTWEIFDLAELATNQAWAAAGFCYPPLYGSVCSYGSAALANQLVLGGFQLMWQVSNTPSSDPKVGFAADFGSFYMEHDVAHSLSDPSGWSLFQRPSYVQSGCMGAGLGAIDTVNHLLYSGCANSSPSPQAYMFGPL